MESLSGMLIPVGTILLVVLLQISFWFPTAENKRPTTSATVSKSKPENAQQQSTSKVVPKKNSTTISKRITTKDLAENNADNFQCVFIAPNAETKEPIKIQNGLILQPQDASQAPKIWKCACELGFLPAGILKTFGNAEAMMRLGVGQCYHKK